MQIRGIIPVHSWNYAKQTRATCGDSSESLNVKAYLGLHLDNKLTWQKHVKTKRQQLNLRLREMLWLLGLKSKLSVENKLLLYKCIIKPI
jgi:hypothetical protein